MSVVWEDPPPPPVTDWAAVVEALKANPGRWARVVRKASASSTTYVKSRYGCEVRAVVVSRDPYRFDIYARWPESGDPS